MAYIVYDSLRGGPYSHKAGEFCGNVLRRNVAVFGNGKIVTMNPAVVAQLPLLFVGGEIAFKIGKPAGNERFSSEEFTRYGYVGFYLAEDLPLPEDAVEIDTDIFSEEVVSGEYLPLRPIDISKIRRKEF